MDYTQTQRQTHESSCDCRASESSPLFSTSPKAQQSQLLAPSITHLLPAHTHSRMWPPSSLAPDAQIQRGCVSVSFAEFSSRARGPHASTPSFPHTSQSEVRSLVAGQQACYSHGAGASASSPGSSSASSCVATMVSTRWSRCVCERRARQCGRDGGGSSSRCE